MIIKKSLKNKNPAAHSKDRISFIYGTKSSQISSPVSFSKTPGSVHKLPILDLKPRNSLKRDNSVVTTNYTSKHTRNDSKRPGHLDMVQALFTDIIKADYKNGKTLKRIKDYYDSHIKKLEGQISVSCRNQVEYLSRENFRLSKEIEKYEMKGKTKSIFCTDIPKLKLQSASTLSFHQEFMKKAEEFSASWREALKEGR